MASNRSALIDAVRSSALCATLIASAAGTAIAQPPPTPPANPSQRAVLPTIDPAKELKGQALVDALRGGGYVLLMRHAKQDGVQETLPCTHRNLSIEGETDARKIGAALRELRIPIRAVRASTVCRAIETAAALGVGDVESTPDLDPGTSWTPQIHAARARQLATRPAGAANSLLVSHIHPSSNDDERVQYDHCEIIVYQPGEQGASTPVARIPRHSWDALILLR